MKKTLILGFILALFSSYSYADFDKKNFYVGVETGINQYSLLGLSYYYVPYNVNLGYNFRNTLPVRLEYSYSSYLSSSLNGYYDFYNFKKVSPYIQAGAGFNGLSAGLGLSYDFSEKITTYAGFKYTFGNYYGVLDYNIKSFVIGGNYTF